MFVDFDVSGQRGWTLYWRKLYYGLWSYILARSEGLSSNVPMMDLLNLITAHRLSSEQKKKMQIEKMILNANKDKIKTPNQPEN